jgi:hypothetical protein
MSLLAHFFRRPRPAKPARRRFVGASVSMKVSEALIAAACSNFRVLIQKDLMAGVSFEEVNTLALLHFKPWSREVWECEDIARNLVNEAQKIAANEGCSWAIGTVRARPPDWNIDSLRVDALHVYVWFITSEGAVNFYDPTACKAVHSGDVLESDYVLT